MKPEKLILCGWGPYKEETVIDFKKLNSAGLFLVTGQTGAGKTTIFDAIAYALYGVLSGEVREKGTVRSDFAGEDTKTYVELYMRHKNEVYHISRNPEYLRPKKRKSGENAFTKEKENAVLTMPDGSIIAGNQDVTAKLEELLHMDSRQFRQISMIAQGEFSKMLFASSTEKNAIFRELFGTGIYAQIQAQLKTRSGHLYQEYMVYKNKIEEDIHLLDLQDEEWKNLAYSESLDLFSIVDYLKTALKDEKTKLSKKKKEADSLEEGLLSLQKEIENIRQINARFQELEQNQNRIEELAEKQPQMTSLEKQIHTAKMVQVLFFEEKVLLEKEQAAAEVVNRIKCLETELSELCKYEKEQENILKIKDAALEAFEVTEQLTEVENAIKQQVQKKEQQEKQLKKARAAYEEAQKEAEKNNRCYEEADVRYKKAVIGIAAKLVKEGEPCPVCGSLDHPRIAHMEEEIPDEKQLELLKEKAQKSRMEESRLYEEALLLANEEKRLQEMLQELGEEKEHLGQKMNSFALEVLDYIRFHTRMQLEQVVKKSLEIQTMRQEKLRNLEEYKVQEQQKKADVEENRRIFEKKLKESGFSEEEQYRSAVNMLDCLADWEKEYRSYEDAFMTAKKMQEYLQNSLKGCEIKAEEPYNEEWTNKQAALKECRKVMELANVTISQMTRSLDGIETNRKKAENIREEYGIVKDLDDLANGNNSRRLVFEQYVLAGYFENILKAANIRLSNMTDGRYELLRAGRVSDGRKKDNLEIEVMDYYTGRKRSVKTLSGGETFKASLAMALGMSDCIQAENGGMEVETLFIDEGFGALDEESLEQACETLQTLAGKNRMVGVISHVAQLRERIEHQIIVEKKNNGSFVKTI